jgi:hypothetical protein
MCIRVGSIFIQADGFSLDRYLACRFSLAERPQSDTEGRSPGVVCSALVRRPS